MSKIKQKIFKRGKSCCLCSGVVNVGMSPDSHTMQGAHQHTFCSHLKYVLSRNLDQNMLKMHIFGKKLQKSLQRLRLRPRTTLASSG